MQTRKRFFERGYTPVAVLSIAAILVAVAMSLDSAKIAIDERAQLAAGPALSPSSNPAPVANPAATTDDAGLKDTVTKYCRVGEDYSVREHEDGKAVVDVDVPNKCAGKTPSEFSADGRACSFTAQYPWKCKVKYCLPGALTADEKEHCVPIPDAVPGQAVTGAVMQRDYRVSLLADELASASQGSSAYERIAGHIQASESQPILGAFDAAAIEQQNNLAQSTDQYNALMLDLYKCGGTDASCPQLAKIDAARNIVSQDEKRLADVYNKNFNPNDVGRVTEGTKLCTTGNDNCYNIPQPVLCPGGPGCRGGTWSPEAGRLVDNTTIRRERETGGGLFDRWGTRETGYSSGGGYGSGANYCVTNLFPVMVSGGPWRPGCLNNPSTQFGQQQCNPIQQIISGCPNPFNPYQQQCGGLMLMLDKCPQGSYNPSNPSNPYNMPTPTCSIQVSPSNVSAAGQPTTLQWQSQGASYAYLSNSGQIGPSGSMTVYPQSPTTYVMTVVGYGNQQGRCQTQVTVGGQGGSTGQPTAQISCQPQLADVGTQVGISFACQNSTVASGSGFPTNGALSGNATAVVQQPSIGINTVTYGLTCSNQGITHSAQCTVNVNKAAIVLVANPKTVQSGGESNIGWVSSGMNACTISSPTLSAFTTSNASSTAVSGTAKTGALTQSASFVLACETKAGVTKTATTTVTVN